MLANANISAATMDIPSPAELIEKIETFCVRHEMAPTRFGRDAINDPNLLTDLNAGRRLPGLAKLQRIADFMARKDGELIDSDHARADNAMAAQHHG